MGMRIQVLLLMVTLWSVDVLRAQTPPEILDVPATCANDDECQAAKPDSKCVMANVQAGDGSNVQSPKCACIAAENWHRNADQSACILDVAPMDTCYEGRSRCTDAASECILDGSNTGAMRCLCMSGYITVQDATDSTKYVCGKEITAEQDENCAPCIANQGHCYDTDADGTMNGCQCLLSQTGTDCETIHLAVTCTATHKTICYGPMQADVDFAAGSKLYAEGHEGDPECVGSVLTADTATTVCPDGNVQLILPLEAEARDTCGTKEIAGKSFARLETMITLTRINDAFDFHFKTFCGFQRETAEQFQGFNVLAAAGNDRGETHYPSLTLKVMDAAGDPLGSNPVLRSGDYVKFAIDLTLADPVIYSSIKADRCMFSTSGTIDVGFLSANNENTKQVVENGCPATGQNQIDQFNIWKRNGLGKRNTLETGLIKAVKFGNSDMVFLHCNVKLCTANNEADCDPTTCTGGEQGLGRRRKRAAAQIEETSGNNVDVPLAIGLRFSDGDDSDKSGSSETSSSTVIWITVVMVCAFVAFVVIGAFLLWRVKNKEAKVVDYTPDKPQRFALPRMERNMKI